MAESFQKRRNRQRRTRVNIAYDVHIGDALETKELPFIMGVLSDLSGDGAESLPEIADRKFTEITPDNFDKVLKGMKPSLSFTVDNKLDPDSEDKLGISLEFEKFEDFSPEQIAENVEPLAELLEKRKDLTNLKAKLASNRNLNREIQAALGDDDKRARLKTEIESEGDGDSEGGDDNG